MCPSARAPPATSTCPCATRPPSHRDGGYASAPPRSSYFAKGHRSPQRRELDASDGPEGSPPQLALGRPQERSRCVGASPQHRGACPLPAIATRLVELCVAGQ